MPRPAVTAGTRHSEAAMSVLMFGLLLSMVLVIAAVVLSASDGDGLSNA